MKKALFLIGISVMILQSCKKYEEGPGISLRSKKERVANKWVIKKSYYNGKESISSTVTFSLEYKKDGVFLYQHYGSIPQEEPIKGTWKFGNNKETLITHLSTKCPIDVEPYDTVYILKLEENELWTYKNTPLGKREFHYKPI